VYQNHQECGKKQNIFNYWEASLIYDCCCGKNKVSGQEHQTTRPGPESDAVGLGRKTDLDAHLYHQFKVPLGSIPFPWRPVKCCQPPAIYADLKAGFVVISYSVR